MIYAQNENRKNTGLNICMDYRMIILVPHDMTCRKKTVEEILAGENDFNSAKKHFLKGMGRNLFTFKTTLMRIIGRKSGNNNRIKRVRHLQVEQMQKCCLK